MKLPHSRGYLLAVGGGEVRYRWAIGTTRWGRDVIDWVPFEGANATREVRVSKGGGGVLPGLGFGVHGRVGGWMDGGEPASRHACWQPCRMRLLPRPPSCGAERRESAVRRVGCQALLAWAVFRSQPWWCCSCTQLPANVRPTGVRYGELLTITKYTCTSPPQHSLPTASLPPLAAPPHWHLPSHRPPAATSPGASSSWTGRWRRCR